MDSAPTPLRGKSEPARRPTRRVVVITGASSGVGRACVRAFAGRGYDVGLIARGRPGLAAAAVEARTLGARTCVVHADVSDAAAIDDAAGRIEERLGPVDVWVNNAMAAVFAPFLDVTAEEFDRVIAVTFGGQVNGTRAALTRMHARNHGTIVQVGSALAYRGIPLQSGYCAAKHATQGLCDSLRAELTHDRSRVHVTMVQLPALNTPQFDLQRNKLPRKPQPVPPIFQPELAASAIVFAAEHRRREVWVTMPTVRAILGDRLMPGVLDRLLGRTGYASQQRCIPARPDDEDVLFSPADHDPGPHGSFDAQAKGGSLQLRLTTSPTLNRVRSLIGVPLGAASARVLARVM